MSTEDKLKDLILRRYYSVRDFTIKHDIPYTTVYSIFKRGIGNSSVTNVIKICKALGISADALADGEIKPITEFSAMMMNDTLDIKDLADDTRKVLTHGHATIDGKPLDAKQIDHIVEGIDLVIEMTRRKK